MERKQIISEGTTNLLMDINYAYPNIKYSSLADQLDDFKLNNSTKNQKRVP